MFSTSHFRLKMYIEVEMIDEFSDSFIADNCIVQIEELFYLRPGSQIDDRFLNSVSLEYLYTSGVNRGPKGEVYSRGV